MKAWRLVCVAGAVLLGPLTMTAQQRGPLRAGVAKVEITPPKEMFPFKLGGMTLVDAHDPLFVRALVLDNGQTKIALLSVDTTMLPNGPELTKAVAEELKIPESHVSVAGTHDHNTPTAGPPGKRGPELQPYLDFVQKQVVEAARQAEAQEQPARIGFGTGKSYVNVNRDQKVGDRYMMGFSPEGPTDKTVTVMKLTRPDGQPFAVWANYPVHSTVMYTSKTKDGASEVTGDLAGWTERYVEEHIPGVVAVYTMGPAGDQQPIYQSVYDQGQPFTHDAEEAGWAILDVQARRLGEEMVRVTNSIENTTDKAVLWAEDTTVSCPGRVRDPNVPRGQAGPGGAQKMVDGPPVNIHLGLIMINDIALPNVTGEVFTEIWQKLRSQSPFDRTAMITLNGGSIGYIPSEHAYLLPSQMAVNNAIRPGCAEDLLVDTLLKMEKDYVPVWTATN